MKIIYTDENRRLKELAELFGSKQFKSFLKENLGRVSEYDRRMLRVQPSLCKDVFSQFLNAQGFELSTKTEHAYNIANNNMSYVQDLESGEFVGALHLNSDLHSSVYCYVSDIHNNCVSLMYEISPKHFRVEKEVSVDWSQYQFGKEEEILHLIDEAIRAGILQEGPSGGVMAYMEYEDGSEGWEEISKDMAVQDLLIQENYQELSAALKAQTGLINMDTSGFSVPGLAGTWHSVDHVEVDGHLFWLMENDERSNDGCIIVNEKGIPSLTRVTNGLNEHAVKLLRQELMPVSRMPDSSISVEDMKDYGYFWGGMLPMREDTATKFWEWNDCPVYRLYEDDSEGLIEDIKEFKDHANQGGIFGVEKVDWVRFQLSFHYTPNVDKPSLADLIVGAASREGKSSSMVEKAGHDGPGGR